jgi:hypothetical protein
MGCCLGIKSSSFDSFPAFNNQQASSKRFNLTVLTSLTLTIQSSDCVRVVLDSLMVLSIFLANKKKVEFKLKLFKEK